MRHCKDCGREIESGIWCRGCTTKIDASLEASAPTLTTLGVSEDRYQQYADRQYKVRFAARRCPYCGTTKEREQPCIKCDAHRYPAPANAELSMLVSAVVRCQREWNEVAGEVGGTDCGHIVARHYRAELESLLHAAGHTVESYNEEVTFRISSKYAYFQGLLAQFND